MAQTKLLRQTLEALPPVHASSTTLRTKIRDQLSATKSTPILVVLDDDPTGTQTCHNINVLTTWSTSVLITELASTPAGSGLFILTNSRALHPDGADKLITEICSNLKEAAQQTGKDIEVVLRGDSTLRGHFPLEPEAVESVLGKSDIWLLAPFFLQGGRYTVEDVHYVAEGDTLVPAGETPFAKDATFGYKSSNLRDWIVEKTTQSGRKIDKDHIDSFDLATLRQEGPEYISRKLFAAQKGTVMVVNAADEADMDVVILGVLQAATKGLRILYRTGAAFVSARLGISPIPPITTAQLADSFTPNHGGLTIAGSYVPKTTAQLQILTERSGSALTTIELDVEKLIKGDDIIAAALKTAEAEISNGQDVLIMTSRKLVTGADERASLDIGSTVARALVDFLQRLTIRPRYIIAKGGITSADMAKQGLNISKALIVGQALPGVPLWRSDEETSRWSGLPYVVFPGNVGGEDALFELVRDWRK